MQRCLRTSDLEEVGDSYHLTVFEMLGTWSLGDYDGPQSQRFGLELLTDGFGLAPGLMHATVFGGDDQIGPDTDAERTWLKLGLPVERLHAGQLVVQRPDRAVRSRLEIFVWTGDGPPSGTPGTDERWLELWNHVTMRYDRQEDGSLRPLRQCSVDTGMGLERLMMVRSGAALGVRHRPVRAVAAGPAEALADRRPVTAAGDRPPALGDRRDRRLRVRPPSTGRGYVLRRLVRRALTRTVAGR